MDGPTLFDPPEGDDDEPTRALASGEGRGSWWHPSHGRHAPEDYRRRVRRAAGELAAMRPAERRDLLAERARARSRRRVDDPRPEVREAERSRRRLLRPVG